MEFNLINPIAERKTKTVYRDGDKTIKLFVENYSKANILNEALIQSRVEENTDLKISRLLEVSKIQDRWALVTEYVEGTPLDVLMKEYPEKEEEYLEFFVNVQMEVLSKRVPLLNRTKDKYKRKLTEAQNIDENAKYELLQRLEGMKNHDKLCHGDFVPSNIIVKENGDYSIIDWSHATIGNASGDVANTFLLFTTEQKSELAEKYVELYCKKTGTDKKEIQRWIPIVAAVRKTYNKPEEQEFLNNWINIVDFQ
jgi:thiamine kinase-like enzyme